MATRALLKNDVSIEEWLAATTLRNKETQYSEKYSFLRLNPVTYKKKCCTRRNNYFGPQSFLMSCYFTKIFVYLSVISVVCYFNVN